MNRPIAAVIFDMDGTLLDTEGLYQSAFMRTASRFGLEVSNEAYRRLLGLPTTTRCALLARACGRAVTVDIFCAAYRAEREAMLRPGVPCKPGAVAALMALASMGVRSAVATSASRPTAVAHLDRAGLSGLVDVVVARDDVSRAKPAPDSFARAACLLGRPPAETIAVEDSLPGLYSAVAAGLRTVLIPDLAPLDDPARALAWREETGLAGIVAAVRGGRAAEPERRHAVAEAVSSMTVR